LKKFLQLSQIIFFYSAKAEFHIELRQFNEAIIELEKAIELAPIKSEKMLLQEKLLTCREN
jgi:predicted RNA polymerase sigma factor